MTFKQTILNKLDDNKSISDKVAKAAGYSGSSAFRRVLNEESKEFDNIYGLIRATRLVMADDELEQLSNYALTLDVNKKLARYFLEYLEINRLNEAKRILLDRMLECSNSTSREWAEIYDIDDRYINGKITFIQAIEEYGFLKCKSDEVKVAITIFKSYCYLDHHMHNMLYQTILTLDFEIVSIKDEYIREMYYSRLMILQIANKVALNRLEEAREVCGKVLQLVEDQNYRAWAYLHLGNSFMLSDNEKAIECYKKGLELTNGHRKIIRTHLISSINFVSNVWNKETPFLNFESELPSDKHEIAHMYIKKNKLEKATEILNTIDFESLNDGSKGFHMYYRGLISKSMKNFSLSVTYFKKAGNVYFRQFPLLEMKKLGLDESVVEALAM
jgi:tetratricopeptide (TPR) repeat protein